MKKELTNLRYERKFVINEMSIHEIEDLIKHNPALFFEIFYERIVNNIYFDSYNMKNYNENLNGNAKRVKIRIRWYGKTFGLIKGAVLELKIKTNELGDKKTFQLAPFILDNKFSIEILQKVFLKSNLPEWLIQELKIYYPSLINSYKRRYFRSANKKYRITLDWDMLFFKIKKRDNNFNEKIFDEDTKVLEIKYLLRDYETEDFISQYFPFRLVAHSKYIKGIDFLNL